MTFIWSIFAWLLIGAFLGWITSVLWRHPQGCMMDGVVAIVAMIAGALIYGAIVGSEQLIELTGMSLLAGVLLAVIALAVVRGWRTDVEAETEPADEAAGWEPEDAPPAPTEPLSEREPEDVGKGTMPEEETPQEPMVQDVPDEPMVEHEPRNVDTSNRPDDGSPGPEEIPDQQEQ
ncbi:MAG: hypothetical protein R6V07_03680 [Armatimonadota bacterium]